MKKFILLSCICFFSAITFGQKATLNGVIRDTINKTTLSNTSISLLKAKDSVLYKYTRSKQDGKFELTNIEPGKYILFITHFTYADYYDTLSFSGAPVDLSSVDLTLKAKLLENVTVRQTLAAMRMKGDTLEYRTDSFKVRPGASVEELLKTLPGIQVDKDGKITAQGEKVEKVLVDGEEFFGDDPTIATRGLQADALEKVQVFDKKSDQATFTGIDDGQRTKTLNLKLKDDKKKGYFGKLDVAQGTSDRWTNSAMINVFKGKRKLSGYGIMSSTGKTGLDWNESSNYGGGNNFEMMDDGGMMFFGGSNNGDLSAYGQGLPKSYTGAIHYSNKFDNDKQGLNGSYRYSKLNTEGFNNNLSETVIANNVIYSRDNTTNLSSKFRHSANGIYDLQIDSFTSIKITANGQQGESRGTSNFYGEVLQQSINKKSTRTGFSTTDGSNNSFNSSLLLRKRFRKPGRTISLNVDQQHNTNNSTGIQYTLNEYFSASAKDSSRIVDQSKINKSDNNSLTSRLVYTEPLSKKVFMELSYSLRLSNSQSERLSYNADPTGKYSLFDSLYSNSYKYNYVINTGGLNFKYNTKKVNLSGGTDVAQADFTQKDLLRATSLKQQYVNLFPKGNFTYIFNQYSRFTLTYNGSTRQPSITQVQPVRDNTNTLYEAIGNPLLKQEFRQQFNMRFNSYKMLNQKGFSISMNMSTVSNAISRSETIAVTGKTVYQYINVNGNYNYSGYLNYGQKIKSLDAYFNVGMGLFGGRNISFVNNQKNITNTFTPNLNISFNKGKEKKYSINFYSNIGYNMSRSSLYPDRKTNYFTFQGYPSFNVQLPAKFELNADAELNVRQKVSVFDNNNNAYLVNGYIGRKILKNDKGLIKLMGYDVLNQNKGYNRYINNNRIQESTYQVLTRYFSIGFLWNFAKTPAGMGPVNNF